MCPLLQKFVIRFLPVIVTVVLLSAVSSSSQERRSDRIAFLRCRMHDGRVVLLNARVIPGVLKGYTQSPGTIHYDALSADGKVLWTGAVQDPTVKRLEYEDPEQPGRILRKIIRSDEADFVFRIPFMEECCRLELYMMEQAPGERGMTAPRRIPAGSIRLPREGGGGQ